VREPDTRAQLPRVGPQRAVRATARLDNFR
jgi:hypothetical protein